MIAVMGTARLGPGEIDRLSAAFAKMTSASVKRDDVAAVSTLMGS